MNENFFSANEPEGEGDLIRLAEVQKSTGMGRTFIYKNMRQGTFPLPVRIGNHAVRWIRRDINQWKDDFCSKSGTQQRMEHK